MGEASPLASQRRRPDLERRLRLFPSRLMPRRRSLSRATVRSYISAIRASVVPRAAISADIARASTSLKVQFGGDVQRIIDAMAAGCTGTKRARRRSEVLLDRQRATDAMDLKPDIDAASPSWLRLPIPGDKIGLEDGSDVRASGICGLFNAAEDTATEDSRA